MTTPLSLPVALVGGGNMSRALVGGLLGQGLDRRLVTVAEPAEATRAALERDFGITTTTDNAAAVSGAAVVLLAVKPQVIGDVTRALAPALQVRRPLVISVAAGIRAADLSRWIGAGPSVVRAMPNRPALVGLGATGLYAAPEVGASERELAGAVLSASGIVVWVPREDDLELVTALSGSGPAYFFRLAQLMAEAGTAMGLEASVAQRLAAQTLAGAGQLVATEQQPDLARMASEVASKGGTTEAALNSFAAAGLQRLVADAMQAAAQRGRELAERFGST
jgi:pyrroline-5-carboxylate reductase